MNIQHLLCARVSVILVSFTLLLVNRIHSVSPVISHCQYVRSFLAECSPNQFGYLSSINEIVRMDCIDVRQVSLKSSWIHQSLHPFDVLMLEVSSEHIQHNVAMHSNNLSLIHTHTHHCIHVEHDWVPT